MSEKRLGRGLESLLGTGVGERLESTPAGDRTEIAVTEISANPFQPREAFDARDMEELVESVRQVGVLQPLIVRRSGAGFQVVAGERRLRAARAAGLARVPAVIRDVHDDDMLTLALVENLQREDLNPMEKAKGFKSLIDRFNLTQEDAARRLGKDRATMVNFIRLLDLPESVQHIVSRGTISMSHARALLGLAHPSVQQALALRIEEEGLSVREVERIVSAGRHEKESRKERPPAARKSSHIRDIEDRARQRFGTKVVIETDGKRGKLVIHFFSDDDFQRVLEMLGLTE